MSAIEFDESTGRLRVDQESFDRLVSAVAMSGVATDGRAAPVTHPRVRAGLDTVIDHLCTISATVATRTTIQSHVGWVSEQAAAFLLQTPTELSEFTVVEPQFVPAALARILRLGPRKTGERASVTAGRAVVEQLFAAQAADRAAAFDSLGVPGSRWAARLEVVWTDSDEATTGRGVVSVDGDDGVWLADLAAEEATFEPSSATTLWRALTSILPQDDELAPENAAGEPMQPSLS